jgi:hypothetical protein
MSNIYYSIPQDGNALLASAHGVVLHKNSLADFHVLHNRNVAFYVRNVPFEYRNVIYVYLVVGT